MRQICDNKLGKGDDGVEPVYPCCAQALPPSRTSVRGNNIGHEGALAFAETLRINTTLTMLE